MFKITDLIVRDLFEVSYLQYGKFRVFKFLKKLKIAYVRAMKCLLNYLFDGLKRKIASERELELG